MGNVQVRLPEELEASVDRLARQLHGSRSDAVRFALAEGIQAIRVKDALDAYIDGRHSLARAAHEAGTTIHDMAVRAASRGIPYARYTPEEAEEDLGALG